MEDDAEKQRASAMFELAKSHNVDVGGDTLSVVREVRGLIESMTDEGSSMDTGGGFGSADMYFTVSGVEYSMVVTPGSGVAARNKRFAEVWERADDDAKALLRAYLGA